MEPVDCPGASVRSYHYSLRNDPEVRSSLLLRGGSMKSREVRGSLWTCCRRQNHCPYHESTLALLSHKCIGYRSIYSISVVVYLTAAAVVVIVVKVKQSRYKPGVAQRVPGS